MEKRFLVIKLFDAHGQEIVLSKDSSDALTKEILEVIKAERK